MSRKPSWYDPARRQWMKPTKDGPVPLKHQRPAPAIPITPSVLERWWLSALSLFRSQS
jgi:hypothetical protein